MHNKVMRILALGWLAALLAACSIDSMIEGLTSEEDREFATQFVDDIRTGNSEGIRAVVHPDLWADNGAAFAEARQYYPRERGETRITGYSFHSDGLGENASKDEEFTLVSTDNSHWTTTRIEAITRDGERQVVAWNVEGSAEPPEELEVMETVSTVFMWAGIIFLVFVIGLVWLIVWLVRRSNRNRQPPGPGAGIS